MRLCLNARENLCQVYADENYSVADNRTDPERYPMFSGWPQWLRGIFACGQLLFISVVFIKWDGTLYTTVQCSICPPQSQSRNCALSNQGNMWPPDPTMSKGRSKQFQEMKCNLIKECNHFILNAKGSTCGDGFCMFEEHNKQRKVSFTVSARTEEVVIIFITGCFFIWSVIYSISYRNWGALSLEPALSP